MLRATTSARPLPGRPRPQPGLSRRRAFALLMLIALVAAALGSRLVYLQVVNGPKLAGMALDQRLQAIVLPAPRGRILDRNGVVLVGNVVRYTLIAIPSQMKDAGLEAVAGKVAPILGLKAGAVLPQLQTSPYYVILAKHLTEEQAGKLKALNQTGLRLEQDPIRYYPQGTLAAPLLGIVGDEHKGLEGLELYYNAELSGKAGQLQAEFDPDREGTIAVSDASRMEPQPGHDVRLTIDSVLQAAVEHELDNITQQLAPQRSLILAMDVSSGEILAMGQRPTFDPSKWDTYKVEQRRNWAVTDTVSPGSIFKPLTASTALDSGAMSAGEPLNDFGSLPLPGFTITNWDGGHYGYGTLADAIRTSSNVGFAQVGQRIGGATFLKYLDRFGFTSGTGIDFPGEATAILPADRPVKTLDLSEMAFGQTLAVTPVQMLAALGAVANDGELVKPHLVREIRDSAGGLVQAKPPEQVRQVVKPEVSQAVRKMMEAVVTVGTGQAAQIPGFVVAGKTGTAQVAVNGHLLANKYLGDFVGMVPANKPKIMILVMIDRPANQDGYGGMIAAPVFAHIAPLVLRQVGLWSSTEILPGADLPTPKPVPVPNLVGQEVGKAFGAAHGAGLRLTVLGGGPAITSQEPAAGLPLLPGQRMTVKAQGDSGSSYVPDLLQTTVRQAVDTLGALGLKPDASGAGLVSRQDPAPGTKVAAGSTIHLWLTS